MQLVSIPVKTKDMPPFCGKCGINTVAVSDGVDVGCENQ